MSIATAIGALVAPRDQVLAATVLEWLGGGQAVCSRGQSRYLAQSRERLQPGDRVHLAMVDGQWIALGKASASPQASAVEARFRG